VDVNIKLQGPAIEGEPDSIRFPLNTRVMAEEVARVTEHMTGDCCRVIELDFSNYQIARKEPGGKVGRG
jgi:hypothetical protein